MRDVHRNPHVRKMKPVAQPNQADSNNMMRNQLLKVLPRLLQHKQQHNRLLRPVTRLEQIVRLDNRLVCAMWETLIHPNRIEVPHRRATHDPDTKRPVQRKIQRRVRLLHEPALFIPVLDPKLDRNRANESLHAELAREAQHDDVEADESKVAPAFAVVNWAIGVCADVGGDERVVACERVGQKEAGGQRI